jgi:hypothetical protein
MAIAIGTPIAALANAWRALFGWWFLCLKNRKKTIGGTVLEAMNQNFDSVSLLFVSILLILYDSI